MKHYYFVFHDHHGSDTTYNFILIFCFSGIYTRVKPFLSWIKKNAKDGKCRKPKKNIKDHRMGVSTMTDEKWEKFLLDLKGKNLVKITRKKNL